MPLNTNIALGVQTPQFESPMKMALVANQLRESQMKAQEYEAAMQERNALRQLNPADTDYANQLMRVSPTQGIAYRKSLEEAKSAEATRLKSQTETFAAKRGIVSGMMRDLSARPDDENIKSHFRDVMESNLFTEQEKADLTARTERLLAIPFEQRGAFLASQGATANELRPQSVAAGGSLVQGGKAIYTAPAAPPAPTNLAKLQGERAALPPGDPRIPQYDALIRKETTHAPGTTVNVSTEKKYGEAFGTKIAEADISKLATAEKAPQLAESANRIIDIVRQGAVFTGPIADIKLNIARALNVAGADNQEKIANTESLIAATGQSTLDAIKGAGLGTGQGFTDKDLKFLQGIAGGTIGLTQKTLMELATLQHRAATRSAESWNKRVNEMPSEVVRGTGLSMQPIKVPPLSSVMGGQARPAGVGSNWTLERDAAGNTAWVSPDRKAFKEAK